jgi:hypothetical protein
MPTGLTQLTPKPDGRRFDAHVAALDLEKIEDLAAKGLTLEQIAAALSIDVRTLYNHRKKFREVGEAINRGAANGIAMIANKLFEAANNGSVTAQIFYLKARAGWRDARRACRSAAVRLRAAFPSRPAGSTVRGTRSKETVMTRSRKRRVPQAEISRSCPPGSPSLRRNPMVAVSMPSPSLGMAELAIEHLDVEATEQTNERCSA